MIRSVTVTNHLGDSINLELARPELSGFVIKNIDGLGPVKANINTTKIAMGDGVFYNSASIGQRDIVINLQFLQTKTETIEDIRHKSYKYFPLKRKIRLMIETDRRTVETEGYVESNEPNIFSSSEGCAITIVCPDPYLYSRKVNEITFSGIEPEFEFPFGDPDPFVIGEIKKREDEVLYYEGDKEDGITISIHATGDTSDITIYNITGNQTMRLDSHWIGLATGHYPGYQQQMYTAYSIVQYKYKVYIATGAYKGGHSYQEAPGVNTFEWIEISGDYIPWETGKTYGVGSKVVYEDAYWVIVSTNESYTTTKAPGNDTAWYCLTDIYPCKGVKAKDVITINTRKGQKSATILRDGKTINILNAIDKNSKWFTLMPGDNVFAYDAGDTSSFLDFKISSDIAYDGV